MLLVALGYTVLPHTTDAYIEATGATFGEALEQAAVGLFDTLCDVIAISPHLTEEIEVRGNDDVNLLFSWLETLLLKFELEGKVYSKFHVSRIIVSNEEMVATARISGEQYNKQKHSAKVEVKAVTYHKMEVIHDFSSTTVRFILDL